MALTTPENIVEVFKWFWLDFSLGLFLSASICSGSSKQLTLQELGGKHYFQSHAFPVRFLLKHLSTHWTIQSSEVQGLREKTIHLEVTLDAALNSIKGVLHSFWIDSLPNKAITWRRSTSWRLESNNFFTPLVWKWWGWATRS